MTVLAINGSPNADGNTAIMLKWALEELSIEGFKTELIQEAGGPLQGCQNCGFCDNDAQGRCAIDDGIGRLIPRIAAAEAVILGSPVYFSDLTPWLKALIDRAGFALSRGGNPLRRKPGAAVVVARRAGHVHTFDSINHFFGIMEMITVGSSYWNLGVGREHGTVSDDTEARGTMRDLGRNMAWLLKKLAS
jgi:multimeric flavodoxin WrbA